MNLRDIKKDIEYVIGAFIDDCSLFSVVNKSADEAMFQLALKVRRTEASAEEIAQLVKFTLEQGGLEYAAQCMEQYAARACELLSRLPQSEYTEALRQFAGLVVKRDK